MNEKVIFLWDRLTAPGKHVPLADRFRVRFLASISLIMVLMIFAFEPVVYFLDMESGKNAYYIGGFITILVLLGVNWMSRGPHYRFIARFLVPYINSLIFVILISRESPFVIRYLLIPIFLGAIFTSLRTVFLLTAFNTVGLIAIFSYKPIVTSSILAREITYLIFMACLIMVITYYRNQWELANQRHLSESRERFRTLLATSFDGIAMLQDGKAQVVNEGFQRLFGYEPKQVIGKPFSTFIPHFDTLVQQSLVKAVNKQQEATGITRKGAKIDVEIVTRVDMNQNMPVQMVAVRDITERKQALAALKESQARNQALLAAIPDTMICISADGICTDYHPVGLFADHLPQYDVRQHTLDDIFPPVPASQMMYFSREALQTGQVQVFEIELSAEETSRIFETRLTVIEDQDQVLAVMRDVTERKWAETILLDLSVDLEKRVALRTAELVTANQALCESENKWRSLVQNVPDIISTFDRELKLQFLNRDMPPYSVEELRGVSLYDLPAHPTIAQLQEAVHLAFQTGEMAQIDLLDWPFDENDTRSFECRIVPIKEEDDITTVLIVSSDITNRIEADKALRRQHQEMTTLNQITMAVSQSLSLSQIFHTLGKHLAQELDVAGGVVFLYDETADLVCHQAQWGMTDEVREKLSGMPVEAFVHKDAIRRKTAVFTDDLQQISTTFTNNPANNPFEWKALLTVPLIANGEIQGVVELFSCTTDQFTKDQVDFFCNLGRQVGVAIHNSRLYEATQYARWVAETVQSANLALSQTLDLNNVFDTLLSYLNQLVPFDSANVMLLDKNETLRPFAMHGYDDKVNDQQIAQLSGYLHRFANIRQVLETGKSTLVKNTETSAIWLQISGFEYIRCWLGVPLLAGGRVMGLYALEKTEPDSFTQEQIRLAEALAAQAAVAMQNGLLFEEVRNGQEKLRQLAQQVVMAQEDERLRVSRELHDEAGQALTALKISLVLLLRSLPGQAGDEELEGPVLRENLQSAINVCETTMGQIRLLAHNLRPAALDDLGLNPTLEGFCDDFAERTQLLIEYAGVDPVPVPDAIGISLYRFLQETLTNVARHAAAAHVWVELVCDETAVSLSVIDDGKGFPLSVDSASFTRSTGIGLAGIRERLQLLGGQLTISSQPGQKTRVQATVPIKRDPEQQRI